MTNLYFWGKAFSTDGDVSAAISINGTEVYNGTLPTVNATAPLQTVVVALKEVSVDDAVLGTTTPISVSCTNGELFIGGFGSADGLDGDNPGQLKSNVSINGYEPYNITDDDLINIHGIQVAEGASPGEFHIRLNDGDSVTFDYSFVEPPPAEETPAGETPAEETPAEETPAEETPAGETPAEETPAEETPAGETPA